MHNKKFVDILKKTGSLKKGHFKLSSGLHSDTYLQCALMLQYPEHAEFFGKELAKKLKGVKIDVVISPAVGGLIIGQEVARALEVRAIFAERVDGKFALRRGFEIQPGEKVLVVEDVVTTGGSSLEVGNMVESMEACVVGYAAICDRSNIAHPLRAGLKEGLLESQGINYKVLHERISKEKFNKPFEKLFTLDVWNEEPENCSLCLKKIPLSIPGSRYNNTRAG